MTESWAICSIAWLHNGGEMNRSIAAQTAGVGRTEAPGLVSNLARGAGIVLAGSALVGVCAHVAIPLWFTPVPVTLQPFAVLLLGLLLGPRLAAGTMLAYLAEGAAGLPVFTPHGLGGVAQLLGPTGGYLLSYPLVAPLVSWLWRRGARSFSRGLVVAGAGSLVTLAIGAAWLGVLTHAAPMIVLSHAVLPFLPGDVLKVCAAAGIAVGASRWRRHEG
jgi:biotin transport system substrate-specific component